MDLLQLWTLVRRGWLVLGYVVAGNSATVGDALAGKSLATEKAETYLPLVQNRSVAESIAQELGLASTGEVAGSLTARNAGVIFRITRTLDGSAFGVGASLATEFGGLVGCFPSRMRYNERFASNR